MLIWSNLHLKRSLELTVATRKKHWKNWYFIIKVAPKVKRKRNVTTHFYILCKFCLNWKLRVYLRKEDISLASPCQEFHVQRLLLKFRMGVQSSLKMGIILRQLRKVIFLSLFIEKHISQYQWSAGNIGSLGKWRKSPPYDKSRGEKQKFKETWRQPNKGQAGGWLLERRRAREELVGESPWWASVWGPRRCRRPGGQWPYSTVRGSKGLRENCCLEITCKMRMQHVCIKDWMPLWDPR